MVTISKEQLLNPHRRVHPSRMFMDSRLDNYLGLAKKYGFETFVIYHLGYPDTVEAMNDPVVSEVYSILLWEKDGWAVKQPHPSWIVGYKPEYGQYMVYHRASGDKKIMSRGELYNLSADMYRVLFG